MWPDNRSRECTWPPLPIFLEPDAAYDAEHCMPVCQVACNAPKQHQCVTLCRQTGAAERKTWRCRTFRRGCAWWWHTCWRSCGPGRAPAPASCWCWAPEMWTSSCVATSPSMTALLPTSILLVSSPTLPDHYGLDWCGSRLLLQVFHCIMNEILAACHLPIS